MAALLPPPAAAAAAAPEGRYTRAVKVHEAGEVAVPLDLAAIEHMAPDAADLRVMSPAGEPVPFRLLSLDQEPTTRTAGVEAVDETADGWWIRIDAGAGPRRHHRLRIDFERKVLAPGVALESSPDGERWSRLASSDLFRLGDDSAAERIALDYAPTGDRHLRLFWPRAAGFPEVRTIDIVLEPAHAIRTGPRAPDCDGDPRPICRLELGADGAVRLEVTIRGTGSIGYRLSRSWAGGWVRIGEEVARLAGEAEPHARILALDGIGGGELRVELHGEGSATPVLESYAVDYRPRAVAFDAGEAGTYSLAYGDGHQAGAGTDRDAGVPPVWIEPGPEHEHPWRELPATAISPAEPLPEIDWSGTWRVRGEAPAGAVVRLPLPDAALRGAGGRGGGGRLAHGGLQVPYVVHTPPAPGLARESGRYTPVRLDEGDPTVSGFELDMASGALLIRQIEVTAAGGTFHRRLRLGAFEQPAATPGAAPPPIDRTPWSTWRCEPRGPLPCRTVIEPEGSLPGDRLRVELEDGDNPPLEALEIALWRQRPTLVFVWPGDEVTLHVADAIGPPSYDLALVAGELLARPWTEVTLGLEAADGDAGDGRLARAALLTTLLLAAVVLLVFLARMLRESSAE